MEQKTEKEVQGSKQSQESHMIHMLSQPKEDAFE